MKTGILITIGIISGIIILVTSISIVIPTMEENHQLECLYDGGKVTGFLQCTRVHVDYSLEPATVYINLGALDPQSKNPIFPKEMTVLLGKNNTVTWLNTDGPSHFINFENWVIGPIHQGERKSITFNHTGVYEYFSVNSPSILGLIIVKSGLDRNELENFAVILAEINQNATIYQKNNNQEKFEKQLILMKEKQAEIASKILEVGISDAYVVEGWNYPFEKSSEVTVFNPEFERPICNIPEKIPIHLQIIRQSEMFQKFTEKYSQHHIMIDISDERYVGGLIHYNFIATSDDKKYTAHTNFHLDSCTGEMKWSNNLSCEDTRNDERVYTAIKSEIYSSLENKEFCNITLEPWHQNLREYQQKISNEIDELLEKNATTHSDRTKLYGYASDLHRLGLLTNIARYYDSDVLETEKLQKDLREYDRIFGSLPDELLELLENMR